MLIFVLIRGGEAEKEIAIIQQSLSQPELSRGVDAVTV